MNDFEINEQVTEQEPTKKTRKPRATKTESDLLKEIEKKKLELEKLKQKLHGEKLENLVKKHGAVEAFKNIQKEAGDVDDLLILKAIGTAAGIVRLVVSQSPVVERKGKSKA